MGGWQGLAPEGEGTGPLLGPLGGTARPINIPTHRTGAVLVRGGGNESLVEALLAPTRAWVAGKPTTSVVRRFTVFRMGLDVGDVRRPIGHVVAAWLGTLSLVPASISSYARVLAAHLHRLGQPLSGWTEVVDLVAREAQLAPQGLQALHQSPPLLSKHLGEVDDLLSGVERGQEMPRFLARVLGAFGVHGTDALRLRWEDLRLGAKGNDAWFGVRLVKTKTNLKGQRPPTCLVSLFPPVWLVDVVMRGQRDYPPTQLIWRKEHRLLVMLALRRVGKEYDLRSFRRGVATKVVRASSIEAARDLLLHGSALTTKRYVDPWEVLLWMPRD